MWILKLVLDKTNETRNSVEEQYIMQFRVFDGKQAKSRLSSHKFFKSLDRVNMPRLKLTFQITQQNSALLATQLFIFAELLA